MSYISDWERQQHEQRHQEGTVRRREHYCETCNPRPDRLSRPFQRFWLWITVHHRALQLTGYTADSFARLQQQLSPPQTATEEEIAHSTLGIITSIHYNLPTTPVNEVCFHFHVLIERTDFFNNQVTATDLRAATRTYRVHQLRQTRPSTSTSASTSPARPPTVQPALPTQPAPIVAPIQANPAPPVQPINNMAMTADQLRTVLNNVLGQNGINLPQITQNLTQAIAAIPVPAN